jgi:hypothetical protein
MGVLKHHLMEEEEKRAVATRIALEAGAIEECMLHPGTYIDRGDPGAVEIAYKIANSHFAKEDTLISIFENRREMTDLIKSVIDESGDECYSCKQFQNE